MYCCLSCGTKIKQKGKEKLTFFSEVMRTIHEYIVWEIYCYFVCPFFGCHGDLGKGWYIIIHKY